MSGNQSLWTRIHNFISPPRESYDSRTARPGDPDAGPGAATYEATDGRRHGGTMQLGGH